MTFEVLRAAFNASGVLNQAVDVMPAVVFMQGVCLAALRCVVLPNVIQGQRGAAHVHASRGQLLQGALTNLPGDAPAQVKKQQHAQQRHVVSGTTTQKGERHMFVGMQACSRRRFCLEQGGFAAVASTKLVQCSMIALLCAHAFGGVRVEHPTGDRMRDMHQATSQGFSVHHNTCIDECKDDSAPEESFHCHNTHMQPTACPSLPLGPVDAPAAAAVVLQQHGLAACLPQSEVQAGKRQGRSRGAVYHAATAAAAASVRACLVATAAAAAGDGGCGCKRLLLLLLLLGGGTCPPQEGRQGPVCFLDVAPQGAKVKLHQLAVCGFEHRHVVADAHLHHTLSHIRVHPPHHRPGKLCEGAGHNIHLQAVAAAAAAAAAGLLGVTHPGCCALLLAPAARRWWADCSHSYCRCDRCCW